MHEPRGVDVVERAGEVGGEGADRRHVHRSVRADGDVQRRAGEELGGDPRPPALRLGVEDPGHALARDGPRHVGLADEALGEVLVVGELGTEDLDGRGGAGGVPADVHLAHAALAEDAEEAVRAERERVAGGKGLRGHEVLSGW
ncbi:hypothetical protein SNARM312S_01026 [Streptomyces narbonensis]